MITAKEAETLPLELLRKRIALEEDSLNALKEIYQLRCEMITLEAAEKKSGNKWVGTLESSNH